MRGNTMYEWVYERYNVYVLRDSFWSNQIFTIHLIFDKRQDGNGQAY